MASDLKRRLQLLERNAARDAGDSRQLEEAEIAGAVAHYEGLMIVGEGFVPPDGFREMLQAMHPMTARLYLNCHPADLFV